MVPRRHVRAAVAVFKTRGTRGLISQLIIMASTVSRIRTATVATAKRAALLAGRKTLPRVLNYYKFNNADKTNLINAYNRYHKALNNKNAKNAHRNAQIAGTKFTNAVFRIYDKQVSKKRTPVSNGLRNGVHRSLVYWMPGIFVRHTIRMVKPASV